MESLTIECAGEEVALLADRALYWPREKTLMVADLHIGKTAAFRHAGIPIPPGTTERDLARLRLLITQTKSEKLIVLGDFFHARSGCDEATLEQVQVWRREHASLQMVLVRGNHDRHAGDPPDDWQIECHSEPLRSGPWVLRHTPEPDPQGMVLAGHLHPVVRMRDGLRGWLRMACFHRSPKMLVFPAFGSFTGGAPIRATSDDDVYVMHQGVIRCLQKSSRADRS